MTTTSTVVELPVAPKPVGNYVACTRVGNTIVTSGFLPLKDGQILAKGVVGVDVTVETAAECARWCALNALAVLQDELGSLDAIGRMISVTGYVNTGSQPFDQHPTVLNGASNALVEILGERGKHVRTAVGVASLPLNACVEVSFVAEIA
jgi:enamine deaminase RidA (YjgF/YER057c/UK114 family)